MWYSFLYNLLFQSKEKKVKERKVVVLTKEPTHFWDHQSSDAELKQQIFVTTLAPLWPPLADYSIVWWDLSVWPLSLMTLINQGFTLSTTHLNKSYVSYF